MLNHKPGSVWQSCVRGGGENPTVFWSGQKHRTQPPLHYGAPVSGPLSIRDCRAPPHRLGTTDYKQIFPIQQTICSHNWNQNPSEPSFPCPKPGGKQRSAGGIQWWDDGSQLLSSYKKIFLTSLWAKHLLYSNEKSYWELHVVETEKRDVLCKYCKYRDKQGDLPDILAQITRISF